MINNVRIYKELDKIEVEAILSSEEGLVIQEQYKKFEEEINNEKGTLIIYLEDVSRHREEIADIGNELQEKIRLADIDNKGIEK
jgi:hypothetical protein